MLLQGRLHLERELSLDSELVKLGLGEVRDGFKAQIRGEPLLYNLR
jgi:hypothetical protein